MLWDPANGTDRIKERRMCVHRKGNKVQKCSQANGESVEERGKQE